MGQNLGHCQAHASLQDSTCHIPGGGCRRWSKQRRTLPGVGVGLRSCLLANNLNSALSQPHSILPALLRARLMLWSDPWCLQAGSSSSHRGMSSAPKRDPADPHAWEQRAPCCYRDQHGVILSGAYMNGQHAAVCMGIEMLSHGQTCPLQRFKASLCCL